MTTIAKLISTVLVVLLASSCSKDNQIDEEKLNQFELEKTINKMVVITNEQTVSLRNEIATLSAQNTKMSTEQYNGFVRNTIETYVTKLVESEPEHLENNNLQINKIDPNESTWSNSPNVYGGEMEEVLPPHLIARIDKLALRLDAIVENPFYETGAGVNLAATEIENLLQTEITDINIDQTLSTEEKQMLATACFAARSLIVPQLDFFKTLATGAELLGEDMENYRRRSFFGRLIRAVARVAIAVVAVTVLTALVIKGAILLAPFIKPLKFFAVKYASKGLMKKMLFGVSTKTKTGKVISGSWVATSTLVLGGGTGVIEAGRKWDDDMSLKQWYKEFKFKAKLKDE